MILTKLSEMARREGLLKNPDYEPKPVAWVIDLAEDGALLDVVPTIGAETGTNKKPKAKTFLIPRRNGRTSAAAADFLVDKSEYVLGAEPDGKRSKGDLTTRLSLFTSQVREAVKNVPSPAMAAVAAFLENDGDRQSVIDRISNLGYKSNDLFAFGYHGRLVHELPEVQAYFARSRRVSTEGGRQCLICGKIAPLVDKHPSVQIPGGTTSGVALVSFNSDAFESYGLSRNENAPVCRGCADAYTTALKRLLGKGYENLPRRFVRLSPDTTAVFWADHQAPILNLLSDFFDTPRIESVGALLEAPHTGHLSGPTSNLFYCLVLSGAQGRAVLRGMHTGTVVQVQESMRAYFRSLDIGAGQPLALFVLMKGLVLQGKTENLPPNLAGGTFLAAVFGRLFPQALLARAVERCRAEQKVTPARAAILRAYVIRNLKLEVSVALDKENSTPGYRLGRLMAVLEKLQAEAQGKLSTTIVDRYYGAASTRPATVFSRLIALSQHHLAKCKRPVFFQKLLGEVMDGIASFPPILKLDEQGLFALGYYHQKQDFYKKAENGTESTEDKGEKTNEF